MSSSLDAAVSERKARLAHLRSLKRKQPAGEEPSAQGAPPETTHATDSALGKDPPAQASSLLPASDVATTYLSGRNYDAATRGPRLGFENVPSADKDTVEKRAAEVAAEVRRQTEADKTQRQKPIDLFALQPKRPNWDLKRDLARKIEVLNVRTENAIARLVRERVTAQKARATGSNGKNRATVAADGDGEEVGMQGGELVEGVHQREREEEAEERREREADENEV